MTNPSPLGLGVSTRSAGPPLIPASSAFSLMPGAASRGRWIAGRPHSRYPQGPLAWAA